MFAQYLNIIYYTYRSCLIVLSRYDCLIVDFKDPSAERVVLSQWHDVGAQVVPDLHYDLSQLGGQSGSITVKVVHIKGNGERKETSICFLYI